MLLYTIGQYWIYKLLLNFHYPLEHRISSPQLQSRILGLQTAVMFLNIKELIEQHSSSPGFAWLFKTYVPWHAVAVVLAELCPHREGRLADRAWEIIESHFQDWNNRVTDVKEAMLWGLIKKLLERARAAKQKNKELAKARQTLQPSTLVPMLQDFDASGTSASMLNSDFDFLVYPIKGWTGLWTSPPYLQLKRRRRLMPNPPVRLTCSTTGTIHI